MESFFEKCAPEEISDNFFARISKEGGLLCVSDESEKCNVMTVGWGCFGVIWGKNVCTLYVRKSRYTHSLLEKSGGASLNFLGYDAKEIMNYCGKVSGKDKDKIKEKGLTLFDADGIKCISESDLVITGRKIYTGEIYEEGFFDNTLFKKFYSRNDLHDVFVLEIGEIYKRKNLLKI